MKRKMLLAAFLPLLLINNSGKSQEAEYKKFNLGITLGTAVSIENTDANSGFDLNLNFAYIPHKRVYTFLDLGVNGMLNDVTKEFSKLQTRTSFTATSATFAPQIGAYLNLGAGYIWNVDEKFRVIPALAISNNMTSPFHTEEVKFNEGMEQITINYEVDAIGKTALMPTLKLDYKLADWIMLFGNFNVLLMTEEATVRYTISSSDPFKMDSTGDFKNKFGMSYFSASIGVKFAF